MTASPAAPPQDQVDSRRWIALAVVLMASFMVLLDVSIVNTAIPSIQRDQHATYSDIQWVIAGYSLAYGLGLITGGRLGDIFGRKRMFLVGVAGFTAASTACGLAQSPVQLIAARVIQGLFAAVMYPQVLSVIQVSFPPRERGAAFGLFGGIIGLATISGPLAGGLLIQGNILGSLWRPIFLVNVPVGLAALAAATLFLRESRAPSAPRLDIPGVIIVTAGLGLLTYPLVEGRDQDWPIWTYLSMAASVAVLGGFAAYIRARKRRVGSPLVEPSLFRDRGFVVGIMVMIVFMAGLPAFFLTISLYLQVGFGFSALEAGVTTIPFAIGSALGSGASVRLAPRVGKRILSIGAVTLLVGLSATLAVTHLAGSAMQGYDFIPSLFVSGVGVGLVIAPLATIVLGGIHTGDAGSASGVLTTVQQVGAAIGVALVGIVFFGQLSANADSVSAQLSPAIRGQLQAQGVPPAAIPQVAVAFRQCFHDRAGSRDPSSLPASCQLRPGRNAAAVGRVLSTAAQEGLKENFSHGFEAALGYELAIFVLVFLLVFALPKSEPAVLNRNSSAAAA